jgi:hypothetical protein
MRSLAKFDESSSAIGGDAAITTPTGVVIAPISGRCLSGAIVVEGADGNDADRLYPADRVNPGDCG